MNTEAAAGFPAFEFGAKGDREIDFVKLRRRLAEGARFDDALIKEVLPAAARAKLAGDSKLEGAGDWKGRVG